MEHALLILSNEQKVRLSRMEAMVARLVVDTQVDLDRVRASKVSLVCTDFPLLPHLLMSEWPSATR
jgi:hypothetical protein